MSICKFYAIELNKVYYYVERTTDRDKQLYRLIMGICSMLQVSFPNLSLEHMSLPIFIWSFLALMSLWSLSFSIFVKLLSHVCSSLFFLYKLQLEKFSELLLEKHQNYGRYKDYNQLRGHRRAWH